MSELPYDKTDPYSIEAYALRLLNIRLRDIDIDHEKLLKVIKGKGSLGQAIEEFYFLYKPNSTAGPDFPEAGLELKTTPVISDKAKFLKAKERLVFNIINYEEEYDKEFVESSFWEKNRLLLLMFYLHEKSELDVDLVFKLIRLFRFPAVDLKIIKDDWEKIRSKIRDGLAHELSEGDTFYLGACTKGANKETVRVQPNSDILAKQRAYSLKAKYLNIIIQKTLANDFELFDQTEDYKKVLGAGERDPLVKHSKLDPSGILSPIIKTIDEFQPGETIEQLVIKRFEPFYGYSESQLNHKFGLKRSIGKSKYYDLSKAILNVDGDVIEEFEKADIQLKTIRVEKSGNIKESMSFPQIKYKEIVDENWEDSELYDILSNKFFFVVFKRGDDNEFYLNKVKFWNMPWNDIISMSVIWEDTKSKILSNDFEHFIKISAGLIGHIRPKAINASDLMETHLGTFEKKKSFWIGSHYIKKAIE
ncbi:MAG: MutH/Sau3AI family endonuclease [Mucilaginibacter sp.]|uniref:MutH/Sau3AI family endonuclease n=1 Tax=Mucilaginibacter sp. TaxID=1882438 RepID=UPI003263507F